MFCFDYVGVFFFVFFLVFILFSFVSYNVGVLVPEGGDGVSNQTPAHATPTDLQ